MTRRHGSVAVWRPPESYVHGVGAPVVVIPGRVAAWMDERLQLGRLRSQLRGVDSELDSVLVAVSVAAAAWRISATGTSVASQPEPTASSPQWLSSTQAADLLGVTDRAIRKAIADRRLPAIQIFGRHRVSREDLEHYRARRGRNT